MSRSPRNRTSVVAAALVQDECEELMRKALQVAMAGDVVMLKFLLSWVPRERLIKFELPTMSADDAVEAHGSVLRAVSEGEITPSEGAPVAELINPMREQSICGCSQKAWTGWRCRLREGLSHEPEQISTDCPAGKCGPTLHRNEKSDRAK